jgi:putative heme iron utilization protein
MTNEENIDEVLEALRVYWKERPYMRLGQIIINVTQEVQSGHWSCPWVFNLTEKQFLKGLVKLEKRSRTEG